MTYHHPSRGGWRERRCLGPLRIFTSRERAAQMVRRFLLHNLVLLVLAADPRLWPLLVGLAAWYVWTVHGMWRGAVDGVPEPTGQFFYDAEKSPAPPQPRGRGILFGPGPREGDRPAWRPSPQPTTASVQRNSFLYSPVEFGTFLFYHLFFGAEYYVRDIARFMLRYAGLYYEEPYSGAGSGLPTGKLRNEVFDLVVDTSVACFVEPEPGFPATEKVRVVMRDFELFWRDTETRRFSELRVFLDTNYDPAVDRHHKHRGRFQGLELEYEDAGRTVVQAWGFPNGRPAPAAAADGQPPEVDVRDDKAAVVADIARSRNYDGHRDLNAHQRFVQAGKLMTVVFSYFTHSACHWWANGVVHVPPSVWPDVGRSLDVTLFMNIAATYTSCDYQGTTRDKTAAVLAQNATHGLPLHTPSREGRDAFRVVGNLSTFHQMSVAAKVATRPLLSEPPHAQPTPTNHQYLDTIVAATVMHAADHYFASKFGHVFGECQCVPLETDFSGQFMGLIKNQRFLVLPYVLGQRLLLKECESDISQAIYSAVRKVDPSVGHEFSEQYLTVGCAA